MVEDGEVMTHGSASNEEMPDSMSAWNLTIALEECNTKNIERAT